MLHLDLAAIDQLVGDKIGCVDAACPFCGPQRRSPVNQRRKVFRIWRLDPNFASFHCARCGEKGHVRNDSIIRVDPAIIERARAESAKRERQSAAERLKKARALWSRRQPLIGSVAKTYLRDCRCYEGEIPATLGFLPPRGDYGPAMIAAFGVASEPDPRRLEIADDAVMGVHVTKLDARGQKARSDKDKIMLGASLGSPIMLASPNDLLGLVITEGIEDALSAHDATGLGAWAAGSASRLPALATHVPEYIEAITILVDDDDAGWRHSSELAQRLEHTGCEVRLISMNVERSAA
jgi:hypothetical protein